MWNPFSRKPVAPATIPSDTIIQLGNFDDNPVFRAFIMRLMFRFDDILDPEKLKTSLERLIDREGWCRLGARLRLNSNNKLEYHVPASFDEKRPALLYLNVKYDTSISEHELAAQLPRAPDPAQTIMISDLDKFIPLHASAGFPTTIEEYLYTDLPQLGLYVQSFNDATLVSLSWPHTLFDGMGRKALLDAWTLVLSGREDEVPSFIAYDYDPLATLGSDESAKSYKLANRLLSPWQNIIFAIRYVYDLVIHSQEECRIACIPASKIKKLKGDVMQKITTESPNSYVSEGDVLCAYWSRYALSHLNHTSTRTVSVMNAFGLRQILSKDILPAPGAYLGNAVLSVYAFFQVRDIFQMPIHQIAQRIRQGLAELGERDQIEAGSATNRAAYLATGYTPIYGDATMHMLIYTNWTKGKFFETDFSAAVIKEGPSTSSRANKVGRPSLVQPHSFVKNMSSRGAVAILGKDAQGNYWLSGTLRKGLWAGIERDLASAKYES